MWIHVDEWWFIGWDCVRKNDVVNSAVSRHVVTIRLRQHHSPMGANTISKWSRLRLKIGLRPHSLMIWPGISIIIPHPRSTKPCFFVGNFHIPLGPFRGCLVLGGWDYWLSWSWFSWDIIYISVETGLFPIRNEQLDRTNHATVGLSDSKYSDRWFQGWSMEILWTMKDGEEMTQLKPSYGDGGPGGSLERPSSIVKTPNCWHGIANSKMASEPDSDSQMM